MTVQHFLFNNYLNSIEDERSRIIVQFLVIGLKASLSFDEHCQRRKGGLTVSRRFRYRPTGEDNGSPIGRVGPVPEMRNVFGYFFHFILQPSLLFC
ncbi:hypothetical protein KQX54_005929 [Cotesia glomerata]|uniref:Uncharacterized protein n=1 Tax=Cotesia glomerata TaxID=32391 RepID=A0AAV7J7Q6_COTGL|nr:hypothetical protein KQX54_005929 [Cotesia glomerata]